MFSSELYTALNTTNITTLLDAYGTGKALFDCTLIPTDCAAVKAINYYQLGFSDVRNDYDMSVYTINCRAATQGEAVTIAKAVINEVNRKSYSNYFITCQLGQVLPPADDTDIFNAPIELTIKKR